MKKFYILLASVITLIFLTGLYAQTPGAGFSLGTLSANPFGTTKTSWGNGYNHGGPHIVTNRSDNGALIDMDNDGYREFVCMIKDGDAGNDDVVIFEATGNNSYTKVWGRSIASSSLLKGGVNVADTDGDGRLEIITVDGYNNLVQVFEYSGSGQITDGSNPNETAMFYRSIQSNPTCVVVGDLDNDGRREIIITNDNSTNNFQIIESTGNNAYASTANATVGPSTSGITACSDVADLDGDGTKEIVLTPDAQARDANVAWVYRWNGSSFTQEATLALPAGSSYGMNLVKVCNLDNYGNPEIILTCEEQDDILIYESNAANTYTADAGISGAIQLADNINSISVGDRDGDGKLEIYLALDLATESFYYYEHSGNIGNFSLGQFSGSYTLITFPNASDDPGDVAYSVGTNSPPVSMDQNDNYGDVVVITQIGNVAVLESTTSNSAALPVELVYFTYSEKNGKICLKWKTANEKQNLGWYIEKKRECSDAAKAQWITLGFREGNNNSNSERVYSYYDEIIENGTYYYRLKQMESDGSCEYSDALCIKYNCRPEYSQIASVYPNPVNPAAKVRYSVSEAGTVAFYIYNLLGEKVADIFREEKDIGNYEYVMEQTPLVSGNYFIRMELITAEGKKITRHYKISVVK